MSGRGLVRHRTATVVESITVSPDLSQEMRAHVCLGFEVLQLGRTIGSHTRRPRFLTHFLLATFVASALDARLSLFLSF